MAPQAAGAAHLHAMTTQRKALPDQPDGICERSVDDWRVPAPAAAARRVNAYVRETGDGLFDVQGGAPLYARDLVALACSVLHGYTATAPSRCLHDPRPADASEFRAALTRFLTRRALPGGDGPDYLLSPDQAACLAYAIAERFPTGTAQADGGDASTAYVVAEWEHTHFYEPHPAEPVSVHLRTPAGPGAHPITATCQACGEVLVPKTLAPAPGGCARVADVVEGEVWAWLNEVDAPWSPSDAKVRAFAARVAQVVAPPAPVVTEEQRRAVARVFAAARSGADHVAFYEDSDSPMWHQALAEADQALAALGAVVTAGSDR